MNFRIRSCPRHGLRILVFACLFFSAFCGIGNAVTVDGSVGFSAVFRPGKWTPINLTVENIPRADKARQSLKDFAGTVQTVTMDSGYKPVARNYERALSVPVNDRKKVLLYAKFPMDDSEILVELKDQDGRTVAEAKLPKKAVKEDEELVVYVASSEAPFALPNLQGFPGIVNAIMAPEDLPDRWYGYEGVSLLVIPRATQNLLEGDKGAALRDWVAQGGKLLVLGGRNGQTYKGSMVEDLLPATIEGDGIYASSDGQLKEEVGATTATAGGLFQINKLKLRPGARELIGSGNLPLLVGRAYESGTVMYLASDWSQRLFQLFAIPKTLATIVGIEPGFEDIQKRYQNSFLNIDSGIFGLGSAVNLPNPAIILAILSLYFVLVGPLNFFLLARRKRLELAWITVPVIVILFTAGIYGASSLLKGHDTVLREYFLYTGRANAERFRLDSLSMLWLSDRMTCNITGGDNTVAREPFTDWGYSYYGSRYGGFGGGGGAIPGEITRVVQGTDAMKLMDRAISQWSTEFSGASCVGSLGGSLESDLQLHGAKLTGKIRNNTKKAVKYPCLVVGKRLIPLAKEDPPGSSRNAPVVLQPGDSYDVDEVMDGPVVDFSGTQQSDRAGLKGMDRAIYQSFIQLFGGERTGVSTDYPGCLLLASVGEPDAATAVSTPLTESTTHGFVAVDVPVAMNGWNPVNSVAGKTLAAMDLPRYRNARIPVAQDPVSFRFNWPSPPSDDVLFEGDFSMSQGDKLPELKCEAYNFEKNEWTALKLERWTPPTKKTGGQGNDQRNTQSNEIRVKFQLPAGRAFWHPFSPVSVVRFFSPQGTALTTRGPGYGSGSAWELTPPRLTAGNVPAELPQSDPNFGDVPI
ncbi:MAG: hypothetical protein K1X53_10070 [Candidatus Sumerlaeaceae bacterium]|nr:hypothetical protein [Candidatus Sumerlaeaceae bacterium]